MKKDFKTGKEITKIEITSDNLTGRGGLPLFSRYLSNIRIYELLLSEFGSLRKSKKGLPIWNLFKQIFCFFYDGTSRHVVCFDKLQKDDGYTAAIENRSEDMASSHAVKRFFKLFSWLCGGSFRRILKRLFIWRLRIEQPKEIDLTLDTMVMDNDEADKRHGVEPTYKKKLGFQPLQLIWKRKIVDAVFRGGKKHSNFGNTTVNMITDIVKLIRKEYSDSVTIILRLDSGFFDEINFKAFDDIGIVFICSGKMYDGVKTYAKSEAEDQWQTYDNGHQLWSYIEFGFRCDSWDKFYPAIYTRPLYDENEQRLLDFARPDNVIISNLGINSEAIKNLSPERQVELLNPKTVIAKHHERGADELSHRGLKDFGFEELPFKRFTANSAFYYCMPISFFLFETFKEDVLKEVLPVTGYATTIRRIAVDFAAKIIRTGHEIILKITRAVMDNLQANDLWRLCQSPPPILI